MRRVARAVVLLLLVPLGSSAQTSEERDLRRLEQQIRAIEQRLKGLKTRAESAVLELAKIDLELELRTRELQAAERSVRDLEASRVLVEKRLDRLIVEHQRQSEYLSIRMRALYKMGSLSYLRLLFSARMDESVLHSIGMLNYLVKRDARAMEQFQVMKSAIDEESERLAERRILVDRAHEIVATRQASVEAKRAEQQRMLRELRHESRASEARLAELTEKAERLQRLMDLLYQREGRVSRGPAVTELKGALSWPVEGEVAESFGRRRSERFATFTIHNGLTIASEAGTEVRSIFDGTVLYAQWFKGYGNLVILDHGDRVFSLYGNLRASTVSQGSSVRAGEPIGIVGESEGREQGTLYFEIREKNQPVDPLSWLR